MWGKRTNFIHPITTNCCSQQRFRHASALYGDLQRAAENLRAHSMENPNAGVSGLLLEGAENVIALPFSRSSSVLIRFGTSRANNLEREAAQLRQTVAAQLSACARISDRLLPKPFHGLTRRQLFANFPHGQTRFDLFSTLKKETHSLVKREARIEISNRWAQHLKCRGLERSQARRRRLGPPNKIRQQT